jgi:hypothetical protein
MSRPQCTKSPHSAYNKEMIDAVHVKLLLIAPRVALLSPGKFLTGGSFA